MVDLTILTMLGVRLNVAAQTMKLLLKDLDRIEADVKTPSNQRLEETKKIRQEINKVGTEIDSIKKEIKLLNEYGVN